MNETDIQQALQTRLADADIAPVVYENQDANPARPFLFVQHVPGEANDPALAGGGERYSGFMAVTVVIAESQFVTRANTLAEQVRLLFPKGLRLPAGGGNVTISQAMQRFAGFQDVLDYRLPLRIPYVAATGTPGPIPPLLGVDEW